MSEIKNIVDALDEKRLKIDFRPDRFEVWRKCADTIQKELGWKNLLGSVEQVLQQIGPIIEKELKEK